MRNKVAVVRGKVIGMLSCICEMCEAIIVSRNYDI